jgi:hypothetical protein
VSIEEPTVTVSVRPVINQEVLELHAVFERNMLSIYPLTLSEFSTDEMGKGIDDVHVVLVEKDAKTIQVRQVLELGKCQEQGCTGIRSAGERWHPLNVIIESTDLH